MFVFNSRIHKVRVPCDTLNLLNAGGLNFSNIVEVYGATKSGKTTFCYQAAEYLLADYGDAAKVVILDAEGAAGNSDRLEMVFGLRIGEDPRLVREPAMTIEMANEAILKWSKWCKDNNKVLLIIWDSLKVSSFNNAKKAIDAQLEQLSPDEDGVIAQTGQMQRGMTEPLQRAQVMSWCLNNALHAVYDTPVLILLINQLTTKVNQFNTSTDSSGGFALRHNVNERLKLDFVKNVGGDKKGDLYKTGTMSHLTVVKSRTFPSMQDIPIFIDDVEGGRIIIEQELPLLAHKLGILVMKSGGWYSLAEEHQVEGMTEEMKKGRQFRDIAESPEYAALLRRAAIQFFRKQFKLVDFVHKRAEEYRQEAEDATPRPKGKPSGTPTKPEAASPKKPLSGAAAAAAAKRANKAE